MIQLAATLVTVHVAGLLGYSLSNSPEETTGRFRTQ